MRGEGEGSGATDCSRRGEAAAPGVKASDTSSISVLIGRGNGRRSVRDNDLRTGLMSGQGLATLDWPSGMEGSRPGAITNLSTASESSLHGVSLGPQELSTTRILITSSRMS